jgi:hypothetical protein
MSCLVVPEARSQRAGVRSRARAEGTTEGAGGLSRAVSWAGPWMTGERQVLVDQLDAEGSLTDR